MRHWLCLALFGFLLATPWGRTSPTQPEPPRMNVPLAAYGSLTSLILCKAGERTVAIASTTSKEPVMLATYAYDPYGNCIARDEFNERGLQRRPSTDDAAVEWFPPTPATYTLEVRNQSAAPCVLQMAIR